VLLLFDAGLASGGHLLLLFCPCVCVGVRMVRKRVDSPWCHLLTSSVTVLISRDISPLLHASVGTSVELLRKPLSDEGAHLGGIDADT